MAGARNSLRVVRMLVEARSCLRKNEGKLRRQRSRVWAGKSYQKVAKEQYTSACSDVFRSRNRLDQIAAVKRLKAIDQLNARKCIHKLAVDHFASASNDLRIAAVKRLNKDALDQLILELSSFPIITVSSNIVSTS